MPTPWDSDPPTARRTVERNVREVLAGIRRQAEQRQVPRVAMVQDWHRELYRDVALPVEYYAGEVRDSDPAMPELIGYEVQVGMFPGVAAAEVPAALIAYERGLAAAVASVDRLVPAGEKPGSARALTAVVRLAAVSHGEWIRIHPFANGNGRTARLWVAWVAARYRLPIFLTVKPRPESNRYAIAAQMSMLGDHRQMAFYLSDRLSEALRQLAAGG